MFKQKILILILTCCVLLSACSVFYKTAKKELNDGFYTQKIEGSKKIVYIDVEEETIRLHPSKIKNKKRVIDTSLPCEFFVKELKTDEPIIMSFNRPSLDIDFLTIPLKLRSAQNDVPTQLNTNLNGALYIGYRNDRYLLNYIKNPLGISERNLNHFGFSFGAFTGFGNTFMSPTNTNNILQQEYDGIVWSKGIAGIFALNSFTLGLSVGFDNLLDKNRNIWIYQNKPWLGLSFGLNLN